MPTLFLSILSSFGRTDGLHESPKCAFPRNTLKFYPPSQYLFFSYGFSFDVLQGCQIFHGTWYQNRKKMYQISTKCTKWSQNIPNVRKMFQMEIKYSNIFHSKVLQNLSKLGFLVWKINHLATLMSWTSNETRFWKQKFFLVVDPLLMNPKFLGQSFFLAIFLSKIINPLLPVNPEVQNTKNSENSW
jgi:hypothetical protein